jgi:hexosaminidase
LDSDDVIQWWGVSKNVDRLKGNFYKYFLGRKNEVILSNYDLTYLDIGFGNRYGNNYGVYENWRQLYTSFTPKIDTVNVIGAEVCMWSEIANPYNI